MDTAVAHQPRPWVGHKKDRQEDIMKFARTLIIAALPLALAVGCETPVKDNSKMVEQANKTAMSAESAAKLAAAAAQAAAAASRSNISPSVPHHR